jgi:hypothetical protein
VSVGRSQVAVRIAARLREPMAREELAKIKII